MAEKITPGDGSAPARMQAWQVLHRTVFGTEHEGRRYVVDVPLLEDEVAMFTDGAQTARAEPPVTFPVPGGGIEVATSLYGLRRMHLVLDDGTVRTLSPSPLTAEWWRARFARRHPRASRWISRAAVAALLVGLAVAVPALLERVTGLGLVADVVGTFTSPLALPSWLTGVLTVTGVLAAIERALTLRHHWLVDLDTLWWS